MNGGGVMRGQNGRTQQGNPANISKDEAIRLVSRALDQIQYGEIIIKVQGGKPIWVDKFERERVG